MLTVTAVYLSVMLTVWLCCWLMCDNNEWRTVWEPFVVGLLWPLCLPLSVAFRLRLWSGLDIDTAYTLPTWFKLAASLGMFVLGWMGGQALTRWMEW